MATDHDLFFNNIGGEAGLIGCRRKMRLVLISIASFLLYASGVLGLHQDRMPGWGIDAQGPFPAAVSYLVYGTALGAMDANVLQTFINPNGKSVQDVVAFAAHGTIPRGNAYPYTLDGLGAGSNLFATAAMWMFGIDISSIILFYLVFVGISAFAFVCRFQDRRLLALGLYFLIVTVMRLTPLATAPDAVDQMAIGSNRSFVLAMFLPFLHIFFELLERNDTPHPARGIWYLLLLFVQGLLLFAALLVRSGSSYVLGPLLVVFAWQLYKALKKREPWRPLARKGAILGAALGCWVLFIVIALPQYAQTGRVFGVFWHRLFVTLSLDPRWPFGDLEEAYPCTKYIPEGLSKKGDRNGHCIWLAHLTNATGEPIGATDIYGSEYERVLRNAYFYVLAHYPRQVFELHVFTKSRLIKETLDQAWNYLMRLGHAPVAKGVFISAVLQLVLFVGLIVSTRTSGSMLIEPWMTIFPILFVCSIVPFYAVYAGPWSSSDAIFLMYSCLALAVLLGVQALLDAPGYLGRGRRLAVSP